MDTAMPYNRAFPGLMFGAAAATVFFMAHHPSSSTEVGGIAGLVHGAMLLVLLALGIGFAHFAQVRGLHRMPVMLGLVAYLAGMVAAFGAATINGFVVPALAAGEAQIGNDIFALAWESNQALATVGVVATGIAYLAWSADLLRDNGWLPLVISALGFVVGLTPAVALLSGRYSMDVHTAFIIYSSQALWAVALAVLMWRKPAP